MIALVLAAIVVLTLAWRLLAPISTAPFAGPQTASSVASAERWTINGDAQSVIIRGRDRTSPVLIWVSDLWCETPAFRHFNADLEDHFVVIYWCQRNSGQSLNPFKPPPKALSLDQYVDDLGAVVDIARKRFAKQKVVLIGHSSGTILGLRYTRAHPERVAAYVGIGQVVNQTESLARGYQFALSEAKRRQDAKALSELERIGPPPYRGDEGGIARKWIIAFGGAFHADLSYSKIALISAGAREANWRDVFAFLGGDAYLAPLTPQLEAITFDQSELKFAAPIFLIGGRFDHRCDSALAESYLAKIEAPQKQFAWFEHSAHSPNFEEPAAFNAWITAHILPLAVENDAHKS